MTMTIAITENPISSAVFQCDGESANRLNAAPVFSVCVSRKNPGMIWMWRVHRDAGGDQPLRPAVEQDDEQCE